VVFKVKLLIKRLNERSGANLVEAILVLEATVLLKPFLPCAKNLTSD